MTGLSMRTLFSAYCTAKTICENSISARFDGEFGIAVADDWDALKWQKADRQADVFLDALLAKIDATEAQMKADAERIAELGQQADHDAAYIIDLEDENERLGGMYGQTGPR